ncbi:vicilin Cor a 11.0101-like [Daucus carota subsp. sativus]|uniref:vicilin Cor a 11.0101-like n=1 Tax=Daucus carota subsp. sativus TaxID=79200 RepID=UPI003082D290
MVYIEKAIFKDISYEVILQLVFIIPQSLCYSFQWQTKRFDAEQVHQELPTEVPSEPRGARYRACQQHCESTELQHRPECRQQCIDKYKKERKDDNPYAFEEQHFTTLIESQHGSLRILQKFLDHSKLLSGINSFRFGFLEVGPHALLVPSHLDADLLNVILRGRGRISLLRPGGRQSVNLRVGDIIRVPAGTTTYLINSDNNEKLIIAKLIQPISTPGEFEPFFGVGAKNPESFLRAFSAEILEAALKRDKFQRLLDAQKGDFIVKASEEQIRALDKKDEVGGKGIWPLPFGGGESENKINILRQNPVESNEFGELREVKPSDFRPLEEFDVTVSFANITQGGMSTIFFNSKAIKISVVTNGAGELQMACPHLAQEQGQGQQGHGGSQEGQGQQGRGGSQEQEQGQGGRGGSQEGQGQQGRGGSQEQEQGQGQGSRGASNNQNLEVLCFEINARNNGRIALAGQDNIFQQMEKVAKELAFNRPSQEVDEILRANKKKWFFKGPNQQQPGCAYE